MFQPLSVFLGLRYTKAKRDNHFISFISLASVIGIALGLTVLITVLSLMNGYESGMRDRYLSMFSHVTVFDSDWNLKQWEQRREQVLEAKHVKAVAPFIEKQVMLKEGNKVRATFLQAIMPELEKELGTVNQHVTHSGSLSALKAGEYNIILGVTLAEKLGVSIGDSITLLSLNPEILGEGNNAGNNNSPILKDFTVIDTFRVDMQVYDSGYAYVHLQDAIDLFETNGVVTGLHAQLDDAFKAVEVSNGIAGVLKENYAITNWKTKNTNLFKVIQLQKSMLFLVVILIIGVAAFNLVSTLIMMVTEKQSDIAILRTMGMSPAQVMRIFIVQGSLLGILGTIIGVILGILVASNITDIVNWFEQLLNVSLLKAEVHQLTEIDAEINYLDILLISFIAITLAVLATIFPAWQASKVPPAEALRYD